MPSPVFEALNVIRGSPRYNAWLYSRIERHLKGSVLDIGSGLGDIARQFVNPAVDDVTLSDHAPEMLQVLHETSLPFKKYQIVQLDIADPKIVSDHPGGQVDTITCVNVLEHIEDDTAALKHMNHLLRKGGKVIIFVPALPAVYGTLDRYVEHHRRYTRKSLRAIFERAGFAVKDASYMNMFGIFTWFLAGRVLKQRCFHQDACKMLDRTVPLLRTMESWRPPPIGQSLIMVGEKIS